MREKLYSVVRDKEAVLLTHQFLGSRGLRHQRQDRNNEGQSLIYSRLSWEQAHVSRNLNAVSLFMV